MKANLLQSLCAALMLCAAPAYALEVSVTDAVFTPDESGSVTIKFTDNPLKDVYAIDVEFDFDAKAFRLDRIDKGESVSHFQKVVNRKEGGSLTKVALIGLFPLNAIEGDLLTLHFTAHNHSSATRNHALNVTHVLFSADESALSPQKISQGKLTIGRSAAQ